MSYTKEEFALKVIRAISDGHFGVKIREDGSVLLDVLGFMQEDGKIGSKIDPNFVLDNHKEFLINKN